MGYDRLVLESLQDRGRVNVGYIYGFIEASVRSYGDKTDLGGLGVHRVPLINRVFELIPLRPHALFLRFVLEALTPRLIRGPYLPYPLLGRHGLEVYGYPISTVDIGDEAVELFWVRHSLRGNLGTIINIRTPMGDER